MTPAERKHTAKRFLGMLKRGRILNVACPFGREYFYGSWNDSRMSQKRCELCREAVKLSGQDRCQCFVLGEKEAVRRARKFIEASGILEAK